jgi:hypothetical protein
MADRPVNVAATCAVLGWILENPRMIRIFEVLIALLIVFLLAVLVGVVLPDHGHVERAVEVPSPVRQVYDSVNSFRRFPQWNGMRAFDPNLKMAVSGPETGVGAKASWTSSSPKVRDGSLTITKTEQDKSVEMTLDNDWIGTNKTYAIELIPAANGKTVKIVESYDVDYGWNLVWRYGGLYINGEPSAIVQGGLASLSQMLAGFPNTDYKDQKIDVVNVESKPVFLVQTKAKRSLDEVADATATAMTEIDAALKKVGLTAAGPRMTITTEWGEEDYTFSVAVPVSAASFTLEDQTYNIETPVPNQSDEGVDENGQPKVYAPGEKDAKGMLVVDGNVRAALWYGGTALYTEYTGSPAQLPLLRLNQKAYAETHGYRYSEGGTGRFYDELVSPPDTPVDEEIYRIYLPITR